MIRVFRDARPPLGGSERALCWWASVASRWSLRRGTGAGDAYAAEATAGGSPCALRGGLALAVLLSGVAVEAGDDPPPVSGPATFDGQFVFARIRHADRYAGGGFAFRQDLPWAHDYPRAEANLMKILEAITFLDPTYGSKPNQPQA